MLSKDAKRRLVVALTSEKVGLEVASAIDAGGGENIPAANILYDNSSSGLTATQVQAAIDELKEITAKQDTEAIYVDANEGDDINGTGSLLNPVATLNKAVSLVTNPSLGYIIRLGPGTYNGAQVEWPANADLVGSGANSTIVNNLINYTAEVGSSTGFNISLVSVAVAFDFTDADIAIPVLFNGSFSITRTDTKGQGPWAVLINDSTLNECDFSGNNLLSNCLFVSTCVVRTAGTLLCSDVTIGIQMDLEGAASIRTIGCTIPGILSGTTIGMDTPIVITDASSLNGATLNNIEVQMADSANFVSYIPTTGADWASPPTNLADAIDRIADRLVNGGTGPL